MPMFGRSFAEERPRAREQGVYSAQKLGVDVDQDFRLGPWVVHPSLNSISRNGTNLRLEPKAMEVLVCLARHGGSVVSKEELIGEVWAGTSWAMMCSHAASRFAPSARR